jgi:hypothetical protein
MGSRSGTFHHSSRLSFGNFVLLCNLAALQPGWVQDVGIIDPGQSLAWAAGAIAQAQQMLRLPDPGNGAQPTPPIIAKFELDTDHNGVVSTFQPGVVTIRSNNAFSENLGTNERTCFTGHQGATGWTVSAASLGPSAAQDPIFRLVDGTTCPTDDLSTSLAKLQAYK